MDSITLEQAEGNPFVEWLYLFARDSILYREIERRLEGPRGTSRCYGPSAAMVENFPTTDNETEWHNCFDEIWHDEIEYQFSRYYGIV